MAPDGNGIRFGLELRYWRERQGYSQERLGVLIGGDHSYISRLESGTRMPSRETALRLADALHLQDGQRIRFLSLCGISEYPLDNSTALTLAWMLRQNGITQTLSPKRYPLTSPRRAGGTWKDTT
jgi:transcriptional regulator with XRE-family HTH domain